MMIVVFAAVLLAGVGAVGVIFFSPSASAPAESLPANTVNSGTQQVVPSSQTFNTAVLQRSDYTALDIGLITQGRLPVLPSVGTGRADPFQ